MSHLSLPRIHFKGIFSVSPGTGNNEDIIQPTATIGGNVKLNLKTEPHSLLSIENFKRYLESLGPLRSLWNYYGDNECFVEAKVTSVQLPDPNSNLAKFVKDVQQDSLIGTQVLLNDAVIVDVNSQGVAGPQIFADEFAIYRGESQDLGLLCKGQPTTSYLRWYNTGRNQDPTLLGFPASSAVFQFSMPKKYKDPYLNQNEELFLLNDQGSPTLQALFEALKSDNVRGLTVRLCFYFANQSFRPELSNSQRELEMARLYAQGQKVENPAFGQVVGTIGLWNDGEMASVTIGRQLVNRICDPMQLFGPAIAVVDEARKVITLDLVNTFPEDGSALNKVDLGQVTLRAGASLDIGNVFYDQNTYEATSGVVEVPFADGLAGDIKARQLVLHSSKSDAIILAEAPFMIESDEKCAYMDLGDTRSFEIRALHQGQTGDEHSTLLNIIFEKDMSTAECVALEVLKHAGYDEPKAKPIVEVQGPQVLTIVPGKPATLSLKATCPGSVLVYCITDTDRTPDFRFDFYLNIRVLPRNAELDSLTDEEVTFKCVYEEVLRYYQFIHPAMSHIFDFSKDEHWTPRWAKRVLERIDQDIKDRYKYMPRSRDMSRGRRLLLERWCKKVIATRRVEDEFNNPRDKFKGSSHDPQH